MLMNVERGRVDDAEGGVQVALPAGWSFIATRSRPAPGGESLARVRLAHRHKSRFGRRDPFNCKPSYEVDEGSMHSHQGVGHDDSMNPPS